MAKRHNILILNGPNLNMLGVREPEIYGTKTLSAIALECEEYASELGCDIDFRQSNHEGELISMIHEARDNFSGLIINASGYCHTSVAILDALKIVDMPIIEVHLSNVSKREEFRRHSYIAEVAQGCIYGFGPHGYILALDAMRALLDE